MVTSEQLERSKAIQRRTGRTFHLATRFLPERTRQPTYVLYAFFRLADDVVDDTDPPPARVQRAELERMRAAALGEGPAGDPVREAFRDLRERHDVPPADVDAFVDAMLADVEHDDYETHADLADYLRGSSVAVANMMLAVMDPADEGAARPHAAALAEAFQLTNFLRDVDEDITDYDRVYLPRSTLDEHGVTRRQLEAGEVTQGFRDALCAELRRTERLYREGVAGIRYLPADCRFPVLLAAVLYAEHHRAIRRHGFDVLSSRPSLGLRDYARALARTWWHWRRTGDPEAAFYRASAVSEGPAAGALTFDGEARTSGRLDAEDEGQPPKGAPACSLRTVTDGLRSRLPIGGGD